MAIDWQSLQLNLPPASMRDLAIHGDDLIVATHGRGFWVLDDITALRQMTDKVAEVRRVPVPPRRSHSHAPRHRLRLAHAAR